MKLETVYKLSALPVIRCFVAECAVFYGAESKEITALELAVEEAAVHIIENYPDRNSDLFEITLEPLPEKQSLSLILSNKGLPVDKDNLPSYSVENPEKSLDGLNFFLIRKLTDSFVMENRGHDGWNFILTKKIEKLMHSENDLLENTVAEKKHVRGKFTVEQASSDDAYQITKLAYFTYKYTYPNAVFYYPEMLKEALQNGSVISFIAKNEEDIIVAHSAYMRSPYCRDIAEAGALMTHPDFRRTMASLRLLKAQYDYPKTHNVDIQIIETNLVTSHTGSQRITKSMHFAPLAFKLSVHNQAEFIDVEQAEMANSRETLLYSIWTPCSVTTKSTMYVPEKHYDLISELIKKTTIPVDLKCLYKNPPKDQVPSMDITRKEEFGLALIHLNSISGEWRKNLKNFRKTLSIEGISTIQLQVPADKPIPPDIDERLAEAGFFFSGIIPERLDKWMLLYTFFNNQKFDFDNIKLCDDTACLLRDYVGKCYKEIDL